MISLVIVSHSRQLAEGVRELAAQMTQGRVQIATAGGIDDPEHPIGTDAQAVALAIESVFSDDGVLVLMDLGSAILSAEAALEMLSPEQQSRVTLCAAPLVEGAIVAAVQASIGADLASVRAEAEQALIAKLNLLPGIVNLTALIEVPVVASATHTGQFTVRNPHGLHARPAAQLVAAANRFPASIRLQKGERQANAKSINQVATLGARQGDRLTLRVEGPEAENALKTILFLAEAGFGEDLSPHLTPLESTPQMHPTATDASHLVGLPASPGLAIAAAFLYRPTLPPVERESNHYPDVEWQRLIQAIQEANRELAGQEAMTTRQVGANEAAIFAAHQLMLADPDLHQQLQAYLQSEQCNAAYAWQVITDELAEQYRQMDDPYWQARSADVLDVRGRVLRHLLGLKPPTLSLTHPVILVAEELTPSDTAQLDPKFVQAVVTEQGGITSHSAILARALGIPAVVGCGRVLDKLVPDQIVAVDGSTGQLWLDPTAVELAQLGQKQSQWQADQKKSRTIGQKPGQTRDGQRVEVAANIGGPKDVAVALEYGAEGVGLFRTEFLFLDRHSAPDEEEQLAVYRQVGEAMAPRPVIIRTLDIGGDKPVAYLRQEPEANPFLGWRGLRFCLDNRAFFKTQLRAILRAAATCLNLKIMYPMVSVPSEVAAAKELLAECQAELAQAGLPYATTISSGIMIEVPSAVAVADQLAPMVDFFSIGTNDLTQYVMAADRGNKNVADLALALQPAVLRMIQQTIAAAHQAGIWVGMCGELAGNALATPLLLGLGLDEFSMSAPSVPGVKQALRQWTREEAVGVAAAVASYDSASAIQTYLQQIARSVTV